MAQNGEPILPATPKAPTMTIGINNKADKRIKAAMRNIQKWALDYVDNTPKTRVSADLGGISSNAEAVYRYQISPQILAQLPGEIGRIIEQQLIQDGRIDWFMYQAIESAEETGLAAEVTNITAQTTPAEYPVTIQYAMLSEPHQARVILARSRVYEEMQKLSAEMKTNLSRVISDGMERGDSPRKVAREIYNTVGLPEWNDSEDTASYARALRIARTEINKAHRYARKGERIQARRLGLNIGVLHLSALKANSRRWHAQRHGWTGTDQEEDAWFGRDGNEINCQCAAMAVVLNEDGTIRSKKIREKTEAQKVKYFGE